MRSAQEPTQNTVCFELGSQYGSADSALEALQGGANSRTDVRVHKSNKSQQCSPLLIQATTRVKGENKISMTFLV